MPNRKISDLVLTTSVANNTLFEVSLRSGSSYVSRRTTLNTIKTNILNNPTITGTATIPTANITTANISVANVTTLNIGNDGRLSINANDLLIQNLTSDQDIIFQVNDGGVPTELLRFNGDVSQINIPDNIWMRFGTGNDGNIYSDGTDFHIGHNILNGNIIFEGTAATEFFRIVGALSPYGRWKDNIPLYFGDGLDLKIYSDGTNGYIDANVSNNTLYIRCNDGGAMENAIVITGNDATVIAATGLPLNEPTIKLSQILTFSSNSFDYRVPNDSYAFRSWDYPNAGMFFNITPARYELRNTDATPIHVFSAASAGESYLSMYNNAGAVEAFRVEGDGFVKIISSATVGHEILNLTQNDADQPFIDFVGTAAGNTTASISTYTTSGATTHHLQIEINGVKAWIAASTNNPTP